LVALLCLSGHIVASTGALPLGEVDFSHMNPSLAVSSDNIQRTSIRLVNPEIIVIDSTVNFETYQIPVVLGEPLSQASGTPTVPQVSRFYHIPNTGSVTLEITAAEYELVENYNAYPVQPDDGTFPNQLVKDALQYGKNEWYPRDVAVMTSPMIWRDVRVVAVTLYPVQVNPVTHQARIYRRLEANVVANDTPGENELLNPRRPSRDFAAVYRNLIPNLSDATLDDLSNVPGSYLLVCHNDSVSLRWADTLATWKRRAGYSVVVDARPTWSATNIIARAQDLYNNSSPPLEYICLLGDVSGTFAIPTNGGSYDHGYALLAGGDDLEDVGIGRLSVTSGQQMSIVINKVLSYERTPYMADTTWYHRAFLYAGTGGGNLSSNVITMIWARQQFRHFTGIPNADTVVTSGSVDEGVVASHLNQGVAFFFWRGSVVGEIQTTAAYAPSNGTRLPVCLTITCGTGDFDSQGESVTESWLRAAEGTTPKGGVCGIGTATWNTHVHFNNTVAGGLIYGICNLGIEHLGPALSAAKVQLHAAFPSDAGAVNFSNWNNLMGDPALSMWTQKPVILNVTFPGTVNVGTRRVQPQVTDSLTGQPIQDALVVLWKGTECYAQAFTDEGGFADVPVTVNTSGTMTLTVTKHNHKPFLANISCVDAAEMVTVSSLTLDDDNGGGTQGNSNGILNPGEIIDLSVAMRNFGTTQTSAAGQAVLTVDNTDVTVVNGTRAYPVIAPGDTALAAAPFRISVAPDMQENEEVVLSFALTTGSNTTHSSVRLICKAGHALFQNETVVGGDGNGRLDPNENASLQVTIRNEGDLALDNVTGVLRSTTSFVTCGLDAQPFGNIAVQGTGNNAGHEFPVACNPLTYRGFPARMMLILTTGGGYIDTVFFTLSLGQISPTDPTGPDSFGYYAYDNTDVSYEMHPTYRYIDISQNGVGENLNLNDPGEESAGGPTYSTARNLPFAFTFYGQTYNQITICSNGWAAFGDQHDMDQFRNYSIPGEQAPDALLAPFWDDLKTQGTGNGVWAHYDADTNAYVIQWKAQACNDGYSFAQTEQFEIVLLDPAHYPTRDGNGIVLFQYNNVAEAQGPNNDVPYSTIGIEAPGCRVGLEYRFNNQPQPGAATLVAGRSIAFTTEGRSAFGSITGVITDSASHAPMSAVAVTIDGQMYRDTTDAEGRYFIPNVLLGTYVLRAHKFGYNDGLNPNTVIELNDTLAINFALPHPEIALSTDHINVSLPSEPPQTSFNIQNAGNGPLDYQIRISYSASGPLDDAWDYLDSVNVSSLSGDNMIWGCEFVGDYWWVTGGNNGEGPKYLYRFDLEGNYVDRVPQPSDSGMGWFDMAYDGQYIYGSNGHGIIGVDLNGVARDTVPSPLNPSRALAYSPQSDHFFAADYASGVYELTRTGTVVRHFSTECQVTGLAWNASDPLGYNLYVFGRDETNGHSLLYRMHPVSGDQQFVTTLDRAQGDRSAGCAITPAWNSTLLVFGGIVRGSSGARLGIWELDFNTQWITVTPMMATVPGANTREVMIDFNATTLRPATYHVNLTISNNAAAGTIVLPVALTVERLESKVKKDIPVEYSLLQNYPNPFNSETTFRYDLKQPGHTTLRIYNLLGQEVATLVDRLEQAGSYTRSYNMNGLPSGVYLYRLSSGSFDQTRKLMLLR
jgi:hypothetical protein